MIDDRICIFYIADRVQDVVDGDSTAEELLAELNHNIGINARIKRNDPDALVADLPPIKKQRGRKKS
jgi:hypothetical protein|tara:strand:+ start:1287 stop:1487 length:201 start_codon:yes stop_codon:yes gene_type:complete